MWQPMSTAPKDGSWVLLRGGAITYKWDGDTQPPCVVGQFATEPGVWQFAWYDGGYLGEYETPAEWMPVPA